MSPLLALALALAAPASPDWPATRTPIFSLGAGAGFATSVAGSLPERKFALARVGIAYHLSPRFAVALEGIPLFVLDNREDGITRGVSFSILGRGWLTRGPGWRLGLDGGGGMIRFRDPVPAESLRTNFTLQVGPFVERPIRAGASFAAGYRIHHISNAQRAESNPGINSSHPYLELRFWRARER